MHPYLVPALELSPNVFERLLEQIPAVRLDEAIVYGRFTAREIAAHIADWEPIMRGRIELACRTPGAVIAVFNESEMAVANGYSGSDPREQLREFRRERQATVDFVANVHRQDWGNIVQHPERGPLSAYDLANLILGHDLYHIEQISAYLPGITAAEGQA